MNVEPVPINVKVRDGLIDEPKEGEVLNEDIPLPFPLEKVFTINVTMFYFKFNNYLVKGKERSLGLCERIMAQ